MTGDKYYDSVSERQRRLLALVVEHYIEFAEAIGSRTITEMMHNSVSPATIRNELSELDKMGYLEQPHVSAGRIPTVSGYRFYIDNLMHSRTLTSVERSLVDSVLSSMKGGSMEDYVKKAGEALSSITGCATAALSPEINAAVRRVEYFPMSVKSGVAAILTSTGMIKSRIASTKEPVSTPMLYRFLQVANAQLCGKRLNEISPWDYSIIAQATGSYAQLFTPVLEAVNELIVETKRSEVFFSGESRLVDSLGAADAGEIIKLLYDGEKLGGFIDRLSDETQVIMGADTGDDRLRALSFIVSPYTYQGEKAGAIGVVVSRRADYSRLLPLVDYFARRLSALLDFDLVV